jgi:hypothetical protein
MAAFSLSGSSQNQHGRRSPESIPARLVHHRTSFVACPRLQYAGWTASVLNFIRPARCLREVYQQRPYLMTVQSILFLSWSCRLGVYRSSVCALISVQTGECSMISRGVCVGLIWVSMLDEAEPLKLTRLPPDWNFPLCHEPGFRSKEQTPTTTLWTLSTPSKSYMGLVRRAS